MTFLSLAAAAEIGEFGRQSPISKEKNCLPERARRSLRWRNQGDIKEMLL